MNKIINYHLVLLSILFLISCKNDQKEPEYPQTKNEGFQPDWIDKVGAKTNKFQDSIYYVNDYHAINNGSKLTYWIYSKGYRCMS